jgi:hypothetical protein
MDMSTNSTTFSTPETGFLIAKDAYELDQKLFNSGYTLEQLMELAGLSVAHAVFECVPLQVNNEAVPSSSASKILVSYVSKRLDTRTNIMIIFYSIPRDL